MRAGGAASTEAAVLALLLGSCKLGDVRAALGGALAGGLVTGRAAPSSQVWIVVRDAP